MSESARVIEAQRASAARYRAERAEPERPDERRSRLAWIRGTLRELAPDGAGLETIRRLVESAAAARWSEGRLYGLALAKGCDSYLMRAGATQAEQARRNLQSARELAAHCRAVRRAQPEPHPATPDADEGDW